MKFYCSTCCSIRDTATGVFVNYSETCEHSFLPAPEAAVSVPPSIASAPDSLAERSTFPSIKKLKFEHRGTLEDLKVIAQSFRGSHDPSEHSFYYVGAPDNTHAYHRFECTWHKTHHLCQCTRRIRKITDIEFS